MDLSDESNLNFNLSGDESEDSFTNSNLNWSLIGEYNNQEQIKLYFKLLKYRTRTTQTNYLECHSEHKMTVRYMLCSSCKSSDSNCPARYKTLICDICSIFKIFSHGYHLKDNNLVENFHPVGIISPIKKIIASKIQECDFPPLKIRSYLLDNKQKIESELNYESVPIPTLKQIRYSNKVLRLGLKIKMVITIQ
ncbi:unnamed protein product [Brachionus calyciflorus]|uniref:Uncharacterized protein n=1 Tax=Brachionus calyciflorus TaxID=104777 RepID=A0A813MA10_9BILA|nr:unnamed protein product [Brachionus calyciflorus]